MKVVLTIAGSNSSGGAGIQADLKTFEAFGVFGTSVLTVLTAQNTTGVSEIYEVTPSFVKAQIKAILDDFDVAAIKVGMLYSKEIIDVVSESIKGLDIPIVLDPVFISKAGSPLLKEDAVEAMKSMFKYAMVITPNQHEAKALFSYQFDDAESFEKIKQAKTSVLIKNHILEIDGIKVSADHLFFKGESKMIETPYIDSTNLHGTGCSYSSAITANIALGNSLEDSIRNAKEFINLALIDAPHIGNGPGPINHKSAGQKVNL